jgi:hypothetical protein
MRGNLIEYPTVSAWHDGQRMNSRLEGVPPQNPPARVRIVEGEGWR